MIQTVKLLAINNSIACDEILLTKSFEEQHSRLHGERRHTQVTKNHVIDSDGVCVHLQNRVGEMQHRSWTTQTVWNAFGVKKRGLFYRTSSSRQIGLATGLFLRHIASFFLGRTFWRRLFRIKCQSARLWSEKTCSVSEIVNLGRKVKWELCIVGYMRIPILQFFPFYCYQILVRMKVYFSYSMEAQNKMFVYKKCFMFESFLIQICIGLKNDRILEFVFSVLTQEFWLT